MKIYAVPYAGGNISIYTNLKKYMSNNIRVIPLEMSGHGSRLSEELYYSINEIAIDIMNKIEEKETDLEYGLLGYSMGGLVCLEILNLLKQQGKKMPSHVFLCACSMPENKRFENIRYCDEKELIDVIKKLGGTPDDVWLNKELKDIVLPIMRADLIAIDEYVPKNSKTFDDSKICMIYTNDETDSIELWKQFFEEPYDVEYIDQQHFFIFNRYDLLGEIIKKHMDA